MLIKVVSIGFILLMVVWSIIKRPKAQTAGDFQNMEQSAGWIVIAGTYTATLLSAVGMVGLPAISYQTGYLLGILNWGVPFAFVLTALFIGPRLRLFGAVTLSDFFKERFDSNALKLVSAFITIFGIGAYFISQTIGSAVILEQLTGIDYNFTVIFTLLVVLVFCFVGGTRSVSLVNTAMSIMIVLGLGFLFAPTIIGTVGLDKIQSFAIGRPEFFVWNGSNHTPLGTIVGFLAVWALGISANPVNVTRAYIAKSNREWVKGLMVGLLSVTALIWLMHSSNMAIRAFNPDNPEIKVASASLSWAAVNLVTPVIGIAATLGLTAACLSTANSQILVVAQSLVNDIIGNYRKFTPERAITLIKWSLIILSALSLFFSLGRPGFIVIFGNFGASVFASAFFPVIMFSLAFASISASGAMWSMTIGVVMNFVLHAIPLFMGESFGYAGYLPYSIHPVLWSTALSTIALFVVSAINKPSKAMIKNFNETIAKGGKEIDKQDDSSDSTMIKWSIGFIGIGLVMFGAIVWFSTVV